ncbi:DUF2147 domain-containing protein [Acinetobacter sp. 1207_04]|uniref:DUF2147 domain-containing protein n=1 Tax=Acinetobacter sp. 1207_04 TaxID=2604449 RepID=UPI00405895AB
MKNNFKLLSLGLLLGFSTLTSAQDITGLWQSIDDKTSEVKAIIEIRPNDQGTYTGTIKTITPRVGYQPKELCYKYPAPYTNQPILGLKTFTGLKLSKDNEYADGKVIDPLTGKIYNLKAKLSTNGNRLNLRGYVGVSTIGRSQTWLRVK